MQIVRFLSAMSDACCVETIRPASATDVMLVTVIPASHPEATQKHTALDQSSEPPTTSAEPSLVPGIEQSPSSEKVIEGPKPVNKVQRFGLKP